MRLSHSKKNSLDYENFHKVLKSDRPSIRPFAMPTEGNEIFPSFEPISTNASARASHLQVKQKPRSRSPYLKTDTGSKSSRKSPLYLRTEESGGGDANDGLIFKISQLKIELNNYREKEKKYQLKINELENDKEMLTMTLEKFKKKFNQNVKENKDDKKKLGPVLESLKLSDLKKNKENRTSKETQTTLEALSKELSDANNASYKTRFTELLDYLVSKTQEIETHTNNVVGDNVKIRKEIEGYKKLHANIRNNSDIQIKQPETLQTELVLQNKLLGAEIGHLKEYIKELPNFSRVTNKKKNLADLDSQPCAKCSQPVPSYIKALSLALCRNP